MMCADRGNQSAPGKLWSLWDFMHRLPIADLIYLDIQIASTIARFDHSQNAVPIGAEAEKSVREMLQRFHYVGATPDIAPEAFHLADVLYQSLSENTLNSILVTELASIHEVFKNELSKKGCFLLESEEMAYVDQESLFGASVLEAFPSAAMDIREMGNCFAAERYNAAAYHCVLAAEIGLRQLAKDRRVDLSNWKKPIPLESAQWGHLLGQLRIKVGEISNWPNGPVRDAADIFYHGLLLDLNSLNDGWRRHLSHARSHQFERDDIIGLMANVRRILQKLARRMGEGRAPTRVVWSRVPPELAD